MGLVPFCCRAGEFADEQRDTNLELIGGAAEGGTARVVRVAFGRRVGHAPVGAYRRPGKLRADLSDLVAQRDDAVEMAAGEAAQVLGAPRGDIDAPLGHDPDRVLMQRLGMTSGAPGADRATGPVLE